MKSFIVLGAVAGLASAWTYPQCEPDNCYRNVIDARFAAAITPFCNTYLAPSATATAVPTDYANCGSPAELSSACSCVTYVSSSSAAAPTSTSYPTTTSSSYPTYPTSSAESTSTYAPTNTPTYAPTYTTSTVYVTTVKTITSCSSTVKNCPATAASTYLVTETLSSYTTVCPVTPTYPVSTYVPPPTYVPTSIGTVTKSVGTTYGTKTTSSGLLQVTNAAGRINAGFEMVGVAAGLVAAAFL